jgi:hypothetical protein
MNLKEATDSSILELMHASTGFRSEVLSMARRVINVIRSCAFAYLLTIAVLVHGAASAELRSGTLELDPAKTLIEFRLPGALHTTHGTFKLDGEPSSGTPLLEKLTVPSSSTLGAATRASARVTRTCERVFSRLNGIQR